VILAVLGTALLMACLASLAARRFALSRVVRIVVVLAAATAALLPLGGLMVAGYLRAALGDLSIVSQALLAVAVVGYVNGRRYLAEKETKILMSVIVLAGAFLYPAALGLTYFDPYALGYGSPWFAGVLLILTLAAWHLRLEWLAALVVAAVLARLLNALESRNLWDYLIDPWLLLYALLWLVRWGLQRTWRAAPRSAPSSSIR
jgi:hypothetical protein